MPALSTGFGGVILALPLAFLFLFGGNYANGFAGEIKNVKKAIPIALFLSLLFGIFTGPSPRLSHSTRWGAPG